MTQEANCIKDRLFDLKTLHETTVKENLQTIRNKDLRIEKLEFDLYKLKNEFETEKN